MKAWLGLLVAVVPVLGVAQTPATVRPSKDDIAQWIDATRSLRTLMQSDPHRPIYHFVAPEGHAMPFDPNGGLYWNGKYHLGYIYQRRVDGKPRHVWGHVVSTDLLHWTQYPDMLDVQAGDPETGIFSGGAFVSKEGVPHVIYYGLDAGANFIAFATDAELKKWRKLTGRPAATVLNPDEPNEKNGMQCCIAPAGKYSVFDPDVWYDQGADAYYQISGGLKPALFKSRDLHDWQYLGDLIDPSNPLRNPQEDISCPDIFPLGGGKVMLLFLTHKVGVQYYIGTFANDKFTPEQRGRLNWPGGSFFVPEQLRDGQGRNIVFAWVLERKPPHLPDYGWAGIMSLPRVVALADDGALRISPAEELRALRLAQRRDPDIELAPNSERTLQARGKSIELTLEISGARRSPVGVKVFASPDGREQTTVSYDPTNQELVVDFSRSSVHGPVSYAVAASGPKMVTQQRAPLQLPKGEPLMLNIFLDRSVLEVFANGIQAVTQVVYPELDTSTGVQVFSGQDRIAVKNIQSWSLAETVPY